MAKRIVLNRCCGVVIDVQEYFLSTLDRPLRTRLETNLFHFSCLLRYLRVPIAVTLEKPVGNKGSLPQQLNNCLYDYELAKTFEKEFFDLTKHQEITKYLATLNRKQIIVAGCETDVCVLQSCLGLMSLGYEVYVMEELLFSSSRNVESSIARLKAEGATFLTYKSLYHELFEAVEGSPHRKKIGEEFGPFPEDLPDSLLEPL